MINAEAGTPKVTVPTSSSSRDGDIFSTRNIIIGGVILGGVIAAAATIVSLSYRNKQEAPKTKKKKCKKKSKKKESASKPSKTPEEEAGTGAKPNAGSSKSNETLKGDAPKDGDKAPIAEGVCESETDNKPIPDEVFLNFFKLSNKMLQQQEIKDECAAIFKTGGNVGDFLKEKQAKLWKNLGVDPKSGIKQLAKSMQSGTMTQFRPAVQRSLVIEEALFNYAYHGSQEAVDKATKRIESLRQSCKKELDIVNTYNQADTMKFMQTLMAKYQKINQELQAKGDLSDPMKIVAMRAKLPDDKIQVLLQAQHIMMQQQMLMMQQRR